MVSKGVDYYTFASGSAFNVRIKAPAVDVTMGTANNYTRNNLQIDSSNISGPFNFTGALSWEAQKDGKAFTGGGELINSETGNIEGGSMGSMLSTPSLVGDGFALSFGFYDAGPGIGGLTNQDQLYVYLTDNYSNWMGNLTQAYPQALDKPFNTFALPGAHDSGMNTLDTIYAILGSPYAAALLGGLTLIPIFNAIGGLSLALAPHAIENLALTQKDNFTTMLRLGARYFDFRPGTLYPALAPFSPGVRYHQHTMIPGYPYIRFLEEVLVWLVQNPSEIVVVSCNTQGFASPSMAPSPHDLIHDLSTAFSNTGTNGKVEIGNASSLSKTYRELIEAHTRLIFLNQIDNETTKYDSYNDNYATLSSGPIIQALEGMNKDGQTDSTYTVLQMQGTATSCGTEIVIYAATRSSWATSPLMSTKANFDAATNPWLIQNVANNLLNTQLVVFLNDFVDNCMVSSAITVTKQRMGL